MDIENIDYSKEVLLKYIIQVGSIRQTVIAVRELQELKRSK